MIGEMWRNMGSRTVLRFLGACLLSCVLVGCEKGGEAGSEASDVGLSVDSGSGAEDTGVGVDSGSGGDDAGTSDAETGDAGLDADSGSEGDVADSGDADSGDDCGPVVPESSGAEQLLKPGCYVVGIDGFRVWAMGESLKEAIWVSIERVDFPVGIDPLPEELTHVGSAYKVKTRKDIRISDDAVFFELPRVDDTDASELAGTVVIPGGYIEDLGHDRDVWETLDGYISDDGERLMIDVYHLFEDGWIVALAHGKYFSGD